MLIITDRAEKESTGFLLKYVHLPHFESSSHKHISMQVPVLGQSGSCRGNDTPIKPGPAQPTYQPALPSPHNVALPPTALHAPPSWPAITDLVESKPGHYQKSAQAAEIQACLAAAVQRANANLVFINGFPDTECKGQWLASALTVELNEHRKKSVGMAAVDDRARSDQQYFNQLLSTVICLL